MLAGRKQTCITLQKQEGAWFYRRVGKTGKGAFGLGFEGCVRVLLVGEEGRAGKGILEG